MFIVICLDAKAAGCFEFKSFVADSIEVDAKVSGYVQANFNLNNIKVNSIMLNNDTTFIVIHDLDGFKVAAENWVKSSLNQTYSLEKVDLPIEVLLKWVSSYFKGGLLKFVKDNNLK